MSPLIAHAVGPITHELATDPNYIFMDETERAHFNAAALWREAKRRIASGNGDYTLDESDPGIVVVTCSYCTRVHAFSAAGLTAQSIPEAMRIHRQHYCQPIGGETVP